MFGIKERLCDKFCKEEEEFDRVARISFNTNLKVDHPLAKEIRLYKKGRHVGTVDYSDVWLEELDENGWLIEPASIERIDVVDAWEGGKLLLEKVSR